MIIDEKKREINQLKEQIESLKNDKETLEAWGKKKQEEFALSQERIDKAFEDMGKKKVELENLKKMAEEKILEAHAKSQEAVKSFQDSKFQASEAQRLLGEVVSRTVSAEKRESDALERENSAERKIALLRDLFQKIDEIKKNFYS